MSVPPHLLAAWKHADDLRAQGDLPGALAILTPVADAAARTYGPDDANVLETQYRLALVHRLDGDLGSARRVLEAAQTSADLRLSESDPRILAIAAQLGGIAEELGNRHEARRNYTRVAQYGPGVLGDSHPHVRAARAYLAGDAGGPVYVPQPRVAPPHRYRPPVPSAVPEPEPVSGLPFWPDARTAPPRDLREPRDPRDPREPRDPRDPPDPPDPPDQQNMRDLREPPARHHPQPPAPSPHRPAGRPVGPGVWRIDPDPVPPAATGPAGTGRRTGPRAHRSGDRPRVRGWLVALAVVAVIAVIAAAAVAVAVRRASRTAVPASTAASTGAVPASSAPGVSASAPGPQQVVLHDSGTGVSLTWRDPSTGTVPFIVAGGPAGGQAHPYATLPPGQTTYTVQGLNPGLDYCFTVVAVYATDHLATSALVCTQRHASPTP